MKRASLLGLLISILVCFQSKPSYTQRQTSIRGITTCTAINKTTNELGPTPKSTSIKNVGVILLIVVSTIALLCNSLIIHVVRVNPKMFSTTNYLIVNMALGDTFATIMSLFLSLYTTYNGYGWSGDKVFGEYVYCRMVCPLYYLFTLCSIFSLVAITYDRFWAVTRPLKYKRHCSLTKFTIPGIWMVCFLISACYAFREVIVCSQDGELYCLQTGSKIQAVLMLSLGFVFPHAVILILYIVIAYKLCIRKAPGEDTQKNSGQKSSKKVAKKVTLMIVCILVAFDVAYVPVFLIYMAPVLIEGQVRGSFLHILVYKILMITNGISNALIYAVFNDSFQGAFKEVLCFKPVMISMRKLTKRLARTRVWPSTSSVTSSSGIPSEKCKSSSLAISPNRME